MYMKDTYITKNIAGMTIQKLRNDYYDRIFNQYLPFWNNGGYDKKFGGFMCELRDDGSLENEEKFIWYQGRGIWVYSFLFNNFGKNLLYLDIANKSRDFILKHMYPGEGKWQESVNREGKPVPCTVGQGSKNDIYGPLFCAAGLIELYKASGNDEDMAIAKTSIWSAIKAYDSPLYEGITLPAIEQKGLRCLGHSFMLVWTLTQLLELYPDSQLEMIQSEHVNHIMNHFWNSRYRIVNEYLFHDYTRIPGYESVMSTGHSLESLWMVLPEALRIKDKQLFNTAKIRIRQLIEMNWDYVFDGLCTENYYVFRSETTCPGPSFDLKTMWAHAELLIATMTVFEHTGEIWAKEWYERGREYCLKTMADTGNGIWRQAVDRFGKDKKRDAISIYRKDNFHQIRYLMMNLLSLERIMNSD